MPKKAQTTSVADMAAAPGGAAAVDRALSLLSAYREGDQPLTLTELSNRTQLYKSTALRLIASLEHGGFVSKLEDGRYRLGVEIARLYGIYAASFSLEGAILPVLKRLVEETKESAAYHVRQGNARLCMFRIDSPQPIRDHINPGEILPLDRGAGGRVLTAFGDRRQWPTRAADKKLLEQVKKDGFCAIVGDRSPDVAGISAPVFRGGAIVGAVTLTMPSNRFKEEFVPAVIRASRMLSDRLV